MWVTEVVRKVPGALSEDLKGVVQMMSEAIFIATKTTEAHWQEKCTTMEVTHLEQRRIASEKLEDSDLNEAVQRARASCAEKDSTFLLKRLTKLIMKK